MKVSVLQENLAHGLSIVSRAVSPRSTLPVLANVLVATDEGRLRLSATNLELGITCWIGAKIQEEGSTTVPARAFTELIGTLADKQVDMALTVRTQTLNVRSGASNTNLKCIDSQEFPPMPVVDSSQGIQLNVTDLKEMIQQVVFAASNDEARPILTGVLITLRENQITMAAADGFRLSVRKAELSSPVSRGQQSRWNHGLCDRQAHATGILTPMHHVPRYPDQPAANVAKAREKVDSDGKEPAAGPGDRAAEGFERTHRHRTAGQRRPE